MTDIEYSEDLFTKIRSNVWEEIELTTFQNVQTIIKNKKDWEEKYLGNRIIRKYSGRRSCSMTTKAEYINYKLNGAEETLHAATIVEICTEAQASVATKLLYAL